MKIITQVTFTITEGIYKDIFYVVFRDKNASIYDYLGNHVFTQHYYEKVTEDAAIDILHAALLTEL